MDARSWWRQLALEMTVLTTKIDNLYSLRNAVIFSSLLLLCMFAVSGVEGSEVVLYIFFIALFIFIMGMTIVFYWIRNPEKYEIYYEYYLLFLLEFMLLLVFISTAFHYYDNSAILSIRLFFFQIVSISLGLVAGYLRFDNERQAVELRKGFKLLHRAHPNLEKGVIYLKETSGSPFTYKTRFNSWLLEIPFRIVQYAYIALLSIFLVFGGGGGGIALVRIVELYTPEGGDVSPHNITIYGMSLIIFPILSYYIPSMLSAIRWWKNLERDIQERYGKVVYVWPEDQQEAAEKQV